MIFINQGGGLLFREFVSAAADNFGSVVYYSSDRCASNKNIKLERMPNYSSGSTVIKSFRWMFFMILSAWKLVWAPRGTLLFVVTNPPLSPLLGVVGKIFCGHKYILLFYDVFPEAMIRFAGLKDRCLICRLWRWMNKFSIKHAERVITISPQLAENLRKYVLGDTQVIEIIPTWVDVRYIIPMSKKTNWFAKKYGQEDKLTILYSGTIGNAHDLTMMPDIAAKLKEYSDIIFMVVGGGVGLKALNQECVRRKLNNILFLPFQKQIHLPFLLATGDINIISLSKGAEGISMPSKTYYAMAAGSALLGLSDGDSDLAGVINDYSCGVNIPHGDLDGAVMAILELRRSPDRLCRYRENARRAAENYFSLSVCVPKMIKLVEDLL